MALLPALCSVVPLRPRLSPHAQVRHSSRVARPCPRSTFQRTCLRGGAERGGAGRCAGAGHGSDAGGGCGSPPSLGCAQAPPAEGSAQALGGAVVARTSRSPASEAAGPGAGAAAAGSGEPGEGAGRGRGHRPLCAAPPHASGAPAGRRGGRGDPERAPHPPRLLRPPLRPAPPLMARTSAGRRLPSSRARRPPPAGTPRSPPPPRPRPRQPCSPQPATRTRSRRGRKRAANNDRGGRAAAGVDPAAAATCASPRARGPGRRPSWLRSPRERSCL